jgi:hypothetical protein
MIFSPAIFPRSGFSAFARYTNSAFENYTTGNAVMLASCGGSAYPFCITQALSRRQPDGSLCTARFSKPSYTTCA